MAYQKRVFPDKVCEFCGNNKAHGYFQGKIECKDCNLKRKHPRDHLEVGKRMNKGRYYPIE